MSSGFKEPITIIEAINNIFNRTYLLPAIQRKFTWSSEQIELLFDSIMRGYPINSFMFWKVSDEKIKSEYRFYQFLHEYREFFKEDNEDIDVTGIDDFYAVIDGQQRLTSLYIGLHGTYAYRLKGKWLIDKEDNIPTRSLYLNLSRPVEHSYDSQKKYDFRFLSKKDLEKLNNTNDTDYWFPVKEILNIKDLKAAHKYALEKGFDVSSFEYDTLTELCQKLHIEKLINYYLQEEQDSDKVLEIFIRTNSGGTELTFSDLLMSISSANWKTIDARKEIKSVIDEVYSIGHPGFRISKDFVLKTCLVLFVEDIKFKLKNFTRENVKIFEQNWTKIRESIVAAFTLFYRLGFNDTTFRAKNAAIPIIYYIYYNDLEKEVVKVNYDSNERKNISKWLVLSFLKSIFGGQPDSALITIRKKLKASIGTKSFPSSTIKSAFATDPSRNYTFDNEFIYGLLESQKDTSDAFYVLTLLQPNLDYYNQDFHQDHLHPASVFYDEKKMKSFIPESDWAFASNKKNWNSVLNLQLLKGTLNSKKNDQPLDLWASENKIGKKELYVKDTTSLKIQDFKSFITDRKECLKEKLYEVIK